MWCIFDNPDPIFTLQLVSLRKSCFNKELRQVFLAITRVWCRKSFPSLFEMTIIFGHFFSLSFFVRTYPKKPGFYSKLLFLTHKYLRETGSLSLPG